MINWQRISGWQALRAPIAFTMLLTLNATCFAQPKGFNYDESKVPQYKLPDPLVFEDGRPVKTADDWSARRSEILRQFEKYVYGKSPDKPAGLSFQTIEESDEALDGKAIRKQVRVFFDAEKTVSMDVLIYLPREKVLQAGKVPLFVGLNFYGNHTVHSDPKILLSDSWMRANSEKGVVDNKATDASRGTSASRWAIDAILDRGYGLATIYYGDIDPDFDDGFKNGVHALYGQPEADQWGSISAWAWGLSRAMDYFETDSRINADRVAVMGHSRLGKTSLWAGASDPRFAITISNNSGCGGAALSRRAFGETVARINQSFPHWFCDHFVKYNNNEAACPVDQHELIALIAPDLSISPAPRRTPGPILAGSFFRGSMRPRSIACWEPTVSAVKRRCPKWTSRSCIPSGTTSVPVSTT
ncbi:MAG: acetylxylan esterase [Pirellulaceae bacterium]